MWRALSAIVVRWGGGPRRAIVGSIALCLSVEGLSAGVDVEDPERER
jgi:hypothetical protein